MDLVPIELRLKTLIAGLKKVGGAADLDAIGTGVVPTPSAYVIPARESASDIELLGGFEQDIENHFTIILAISNRRDATGAAALGSLETIRRAVKTAMNGWCPDASIGEQVRFVSGNILRFDDGLLWWADEYRVKTYERIL